MQTQQNMIVVILFFLLFIKNADTGKEEEIKEGRNGDEEDKGNKDDKDGMIFHGLQTSLEKNKNCIVLCITY